VSSPSPPSQECIIYTPYGGYIIITLWKRGILVKSSLVQSLEAAENIVFQQEFQECKSLAFLKFLERKRLKP